MRHLFTAEGFGVRVRPVQLQDASFIVWLRNLDRAKGNVGDTLADVIAQEVWLTKYFERPGDFYFMTETPAGIPLGTASVYDVNETAGVVGRWIIRPGVPAAISNGILMMDLVFNQLKLREAHSTTVSTNHNVLNLTPKWGFKQVKIEKDAHIIGGQSVDVVHFQLKAEDWPAARERLLPLAQFTERKILRWEQTYIASDTGVNTYQHEGSQRFVYPDRTEGPSKI